MGGHRAVGEEQGVEGVRAVDGHRRAIHHDVLPVVGEVGFGEGEVGGEDGGLK
jgi:hypothetical protein